MLRFEHPEHLYALLLLPLLLLFFWAAWAARKRAIRRFGNSRLMQQLMPTVSRYRYYLKFGLLLGAVALLAVGWANPQYGSKLMQYERKSVDIFIAFDLSQSMLAQDITPNRLERTRRFAQNLVQGLRSERLGLIFFAGNAYLQSPITSDYSAIELALRSASSEMIPNQGTAISQAIELADESFDEGNTNHKALIVITDGENHDEAAIKQAEAAAENGLIIYTIGIGTSAGSFIPVVRNGREMYKRDRSGQPVRSRLNEKVLRELAKAGSGRYFNLSSGSEEVLSALKERIDRMEKRTLEQRSFSEYESSFQWFIGGALLLLMLEFMLPYRSRASNANRSLFDEK
jgi:Ca-activated chloride channel homolog